MLRTFQIVSLALSFGLGLGLFAPHQQQWSKKVIDLKNGGSVGQEVVQEAEMLPVITEGVLELRDGKAVYRTAYYELPFNLKVYSRVKNSEVFDIVLTKQVGGVPICFGVQSQDEPIEDLEKYTIQTLNRLDPQSTGENSLDHILAASDLLYNNTYEALNSGIYHPQSHIFGVSYTIRTGEDTVIMVVMYTTEYVEMFHEIHFGDDEYQAYFEFLCSDLMKNLTILSDV
ncbi:MAG: hypothetical protein Q4F28_04560 [Eubacteriales bacterium]|nr:hypothetical protein [Eubacteriales bacterium]